MILAKQGRRTATGLNFTAIRVAGIPERAGIPAPSHGVVVESVNVKVFP
jgi:hypothetical protein